jgi:uncharacterized protein (TIGR02391 family)
LSIKISEILESLWKECFFKNEKSFAEIKLYISNKGYNPNENSLRSAIDRANFLTRKGSLGRYKYIQSSNYEDSHFLDPPKKAAGINLLNEMGIHPTIIKVSGQLFEDGHYSQAIFEAYKEINNLVKSKSGLTQYDGKNLMSQAFSPSSPVLRWTDLKTKSDQDEQEGFMFLFMGAIVGIRNPKAHDHVIQKDIIKTLEYLSFASLLAKRIDEAAIVPKKE